MGWCKEDNCFVSTRLPLDKMAASSQTIFSGAFSWMNSFLFWLIFHWSLFLRVQLTITQHWFRLGLNRRQAIIWTNADLIHRRIYAALGGDELTLILFCINHFSILGHSCLICADHLTSTWQLLMPGSKRHQAICSHHADLTFTTVYYVTWTYYRTCHHENYWCPSAK